MDARSLDLIESESIDLIATHPPYASIIPYSHDREGDLSKTFRKGLSNEGYAKHTPTLRKPKFRLSSVYNIAEFAAEMRKVAQECMRILNRKSTALFS